MDLWCRVTVLGPDGAALASWPVSGPGCPDLSVVDGLAHLQLAAHRLGGRIVLADACAELEALLDLAGLRRQVGGHPEGGEELRVEEAVEPGDNAV